MLNDLKKGELIVFAAPSGAGKSSLIKEIISNNENIELSVSATTRSPRAVSYTHLTLPTKVTG